jgi:hypothetical protein
VKKIPGNLSSSPATNSPTTLKNRSSRKFKLHLANSSGIRGPADPSLMLTTAVTGVAARDFPFQDSVHGNSGSPLCSLVILAAKRKPPRLRLSQRVDLPIFDADATYEQLSRLAGHLARAD